MTELSRKTLEAWIVNNRIEQASYQELIQFFRQDEELKNRLPDRCAQIDPRTGAYILYSRSRRHRPYDYPPAPENETPAPASCPICSGKLTNVWDVAELSDGHTFINANLYPGVFPFACAEWPHIHGEAGFAREALAAFGTHFVQWHSTRHDKDIHNMQVGDVYVNLERMAALEKFLLTQSSPMPVAHQVAGTDYRGYLGIVKNYGRQVGGSLSHGHAQIMHVNIRPTRLQQDMDLLTHQRRGFSAILQERNTPELTIRSYGHGTVSLLTPFCIKRPLEAVICCHDTSRDYLHQLNAGERKLLAQALHDATRTLVALQPQIGRDIAYNLVFHVGPIGGLYLELLPYQQEVGGYENLGIYFSHITPDESTQLYRGAIDS